MQLVARVLAMRVVERVVRMPLVLERPDASPLESRAEPELLEVIVRGAEREEAAPFALREDDARHDPKRSRRGCDRTVVLETQGHVESNRLACLAAIERGRIKSIVGGS